MTPQQALQLLDTVRQNWTAPGKDHDLVREAIRVLGEAVSPKDAMAPHRADGAAEYQAANPPKEA